MGHINSGKTTAWATGDLVTANEMNLMFSSSAVDPTAITGQALTTTGVSGDSLLLYKASVTSLRKVDVASLFASNNPVTTSAITAGANSDITFTTIDGTAVTGSTYQSANGTNVTITTSVAHGLVVGQIVTVSSAGTGYNGTFKITAVTTVSPFTFSYVMQVPATATTGTPSCVYTRQGAVRLNEHEVIAGNLYVDGTTFLGTVTGHSGTLPISGNVTIGGVTTQTGNLDCLADLNVKTFKVLPRFDYFVQHRDPAIIPVSWGGIQNTANLYGAEIPAMTLTFTPKKAGNTIVLTWSVSGELSSTSGGDGVWLATRTVAGGTEEPIKSYTVVNGVVTASANLSVDASNNTWSGICPVGFDSDGATTPSLNTIKIVDTFSSNLTTTYKLRIRMSSNATTSNFNYNRAGTSFSALSNEQGMSVGHAHEICVV